VAGHSAQSLAFTFDWNLPTPQLLQKNEPGFRLYVPVAHETQNALPVSFWNLPVGQDKHSFLCWCLPSGQLKQNVWSEMRPTLHGRHIGTVALLNLNRGLHVYVTEGPTRLSGRLSWPWLPKIRHWWHIKTQAPSMYTAPPLVYAWFSNMSVNEMVDVDAASIIMAPP
jgi:hypothetical protein